MNMNKTIIFNSDDQRVTWKYQSRRDGISFVHEFEIALRAIGKQPFVLLIDLSLIRYIRPNDREEIIRIIKLAESYGSIGLAYLVDPEHAVRIELIISLNDLPYEEAVFKYEEQAKRYLDNLMKKNKKKSYIKSIAKRLLQRSKG